MQDAGSGLGTTSRDVPSIYAGWNGRLIYYAVCPLILQFLQDRPRRRLDLLPAHLTTTQFESRTFSKAMIQLPC